MFEYVIIAMSVLVVVLLLIAPKDRHRGHFDPREKRLAEAQSSLVFLEDDESRVKEIPPQVLRFTNRDAYGQAWFQGWKTEKIEFDENRYKIPVNRFVISYLLHPKSSSFTK